MLCGEPGLRGETRPAVRHETKSCGIPAPVRVALVDGIALAPPALIGCKAALALLSWTRDTLRPAAAETLLAKPKRLRVYAAYACRPRNHRPGARLSEHGFGRAIDIGEVHFTDRAKVSVAADWGRGAPGRFLKALRQGACGPFTTVLGPGSDAHHDSHLHLDVAARRSPYCR